MHLRLLAFTAFIALALTGLPIPAHAQPATSRGPSTTTDPYVIPVAAGVHLTSILTVADGGAASNGYEMVGIPDGLGAVRDGRALVVLMNHELRDTQGIARKHGQKGAFVSRLEIDRHTLAVTHGSDLIQPGVLFWDYVSGQYVTSGARFTDATAQDATFGRFCSGTLSDARVFRSGRYGYDGQIYFANEEDGDVGRIFGVLADGTAQALPRLGLASWENTKPAPNRTPTTLILGLEDGPSPGPGATDGSQLFAYVGIKTDTGSAFERAGLTNGTKYVIDAVDPAVTDDPSWRATYGTGVAAAVALREVPWDATGAAQNADAKAEGLALDRIEDGHWDPRHPNDLYFVTTEGGDTTTTFPYTRDGGGLWRLRFTDIEQPSLGATLTLLLDGSEEITPGAPKLNKPDNMAIDRHGNLLIQEDPGNNAHVARIVAYRIADGALGVVAQADPLRFTIGSPLFMTQDEETSGIIDAETLLGPGTFLLDIQVHTANGLPAGTGPDTVEEYVQHGQLLVMQVRSWASVYGGGAEGD